MITPAFSAKIIEAAVTPKSTSTDSWATTVNQTVAVHFGDSSSNRGVWNDSYVRTPSALGSNGFIDINPVVESGYVEGSAGTETSLWAVNATANWLTTDGTHPDTNGHALAAASIYAADASGNPTANPF
jgi:hypothetical protein